MQSRLQRSKSGVSTVKVIIRSILLLLLIFFVFFFIDKINFPSPQNEINEDVTNKIIKLR